MPALSYNLKKVSFSLSILEVIVQEPIFRVSRGAQHIDRLGGNSAWDGSSVPHARRGKLLIGVSIGLQSIKEFAKKDVSKITYLNSIVWFSASAAARPWAILLSRLDPKNILSMSCNHMHTVWWPAKMMRSWVRFRVLLRLNKPLVSYPWSWAVSAPRTEADGDIRYLGEGFLRVSLMHARHYLGLLLTQG